MRHAFLTNAAKSSAKLSASWARSSAAFSSGGRGALTFGCDLESRKSENRVGLQLIDTVLWLVRRFLKLKGEVDGAARRLAHYVVATGNITTFDRPTMIRHVESICRQLDALPLTKAQMKNGRKLVRQFEKNRVARMNAPVADE